MNSLGLTTQVLGLSSRVTLGELNTFFSYCGTVEEIQLHRKKDLSQTALVTFRQPYAFQTALLLNDAFFAGQPIRVLPAKDLANYPISDELTNDTKTHGIIPTTQEIASKGCEVLNKTITEIEKKYKLPEKGRFIKEHTRLLICDAEHAAKQISAKIVNHDYVSSTANWLSSAVNKVNLGTRNPNNPNSRKQK